MCDAREAALRLGLRASPKENASGRLYYFGARYYDPRTSVWQSADPILGKYLPSGDKENDSKLPGMGGAFNPFNLGLYTYSHFNPVKLSDPDGKQVRPPVQMRLPFNNYRPEPTGVEIYSTYSVNTLVSRIQRYEPNYRYETIGGSGRSQRDVEHLETVLTHYRGAMQSRVNEFANTLDPIARERFETIGIVRALDNATGRIIDIVSSSRGQLRPETRSLLNSEREVEARGFSGHAETNAISWAQSRGMTPLAAHASRGICAGCQNNMYENNVYPGSSLKQNGVLFDLMGPNQ